MEYPWWRVAEIRSGYATEQFRFRKILSNTLSGLSRQREALIARLSDSEAQSFIEIIRLEDEADSLRVMQSEEAHLVRKELIRRKAEGLEKRSGQLWQANYLHTRHWTDLARSLSSSENEVIAHQGQILSEPFIPSLDCNTERRLVRWSDGRHFVAVIEYPAIQVKTGTEVRGDDDMYPGMVDEVFSSTGEFEAPVIDEIIFDLEDFTEQELRTIL